MPGEPGEMILVYPRN